MAASVLGITKSLYEETRKYSVERQGFGQSLRDHQVIRHKILDMSISIQAMETMLDDAIWQTQQDEYSVAEIARLKAFVGIKNEKYASNAV
ncbi:acyl-CoA/acyl-ACP dehydrogenase [Rhodospirillaceae bacterium]|nr:acyl-CoA/acyl-ACP dehydrogenase [Rhodospirillaceae bacterium]